MLVAGKFSWLLHVKLPVKYLWFSGEFTCACRQGACILHEVLAASTQVNSPVFRGKLQVTQVHCVWGILTCELQVKSPAFAGIFARASFTEFTPLITRSIILKCSDYLNATSGFSMCLFRHRSLYFPDLASCNNLKRQMNPSFIVQWWFFWFLSPCFLLLILPITCRVYAAPLELAEHKPGVAPRLNSPQTKDLNPAGRQDFCISSDTRIFVNTIGVLLIAKNWVFSTNFMVFW